MSRRSTTAERGKFKIEIHSALYRSLPLRELLLGDTAGKTPSEIMAEFKKCVKSHLFIDDTITETKSFIFYDVLMPELHPNIKNCTVVMYAICHRDILENYTREGYYGDRADIMIQMIEDAIINDEETARSFGIGKLSLESVNVYNSVKMYGSILTFTVPNFR